MGALMLIFALTAAGEAGTMALRFDTMARCEATRPQVMQELADAPILYAAVRGRFVRGGLSPSLAALLRGETPAAEASEEVRARLVELGLW